MESQREFSRYSDRLNEHSDRTPFLDQAGLSRPARARGLRFLGITFWGNSQVSRNESSISEEQRLQQQEQREQTRPSDQAGPSRPARARGLRVFDVVWGNSQVSRNESSTSDEQRLQQQEQREQARSEKQPLNDRQQRLMNVQDNRHKQLNKREQKIKLLEDLMYKLECRDRLPHENNLQELDDQLYKQDIDMLKHIGQVYMLEKRLERLEYIEQRFTGNVRYLQQRKFIERIRYIEQFERQNRHAEGQQNQIAEMAEWLKQQIKPRLGKTQQKVWNQMMDKLHEELGPRRMEIKEPMLESLKDKKMKRSNNQQQQLNKHKSILQSFNDCVNAIEGNDRNLEIQIHDRDVKQFIDLRHIEKDEINLNHIDRNLKMREQWLKERESRLLEQSGGEMYNRLQKREQFEEDNIIRWTHYNRWIIDHQNNIKSRIENLLHSRKSQDNPQHQKELLDVAKELNVNLPAQNAKKWISFLNHVYEDPEEIRLDTKQAKPLTDGEILMLDDILVKNGKSGRVSDDQRKSKEYGKLIELVVKNYQAFHNRGNKSAQSSGSKGDNIASEDTTSRHGSDGIHHS